MRRNGGRGGLVGTVPKKTEFQQVYSYGISTNGRPYVNLFRYQKVILGQTYMCSGFSTAREAAVALDKKLIDLNQEPINVLKRK